ncbi:MAG: pantothenate kinase [Rhodospirillaceae bacterium]|nr:pantothenate kinase [Rhodospirillaceae bacterium]
MLLAIDCGNTNTGFAVFDNQRCIGTWRMSTNPNRTADEYAVWLTQLLALKTLKLGDIDSIIIANVVPETAFNLRHFCEQYFDISPMVVGDRNLDLGLDIRIDNPDELGADRIVNAVGANNIYDGPLIIIDFGTATTFDITEADGGYAGGLIAPGINLSLEALYNAASRLPRITLEPQPNSQISENKYSVIGKSTRSAMQAGIYWGYIGLIEGIIERVKGEYKVPMQIIATGGLAPVFAGNSAMIQHVDQNITLNGLVLIHKRNAQ